MAKLFAESSSVVLVSLISPFRDDRARAREIAREAKLPFFEIFVDAPIEVCEKRDPKGLYAKARKGEIEKFTGISSPYQAPETPEIHLKTGDMDPAACVAKVLDTLMPAIRIRK